MTLASTLFVQQVLDYSPLQAGASTIPMALLSLVFSATVAPRVIARVGAATTLAMGLLLMGAGFLMLTRTPSDASFLADLFLAYTVIGVGLGLGLAEVSVQIAAFTGIQPEEAGLAGGAVETAREMGGAVGLALLLSIALAGTTDVTEAFNRSAAPSATATRTARSGKRSRRENDNERNSHAESRRALRGHRQRSRQVASLLR